MSTHPSPASGRALLRGIIPPLVTPLTAPDVLDVAGLERLVEHVIRGGAHGLFVLGTTGEGPALSYRLRREMVERTCRLAGDRVPVLVCITDTSFEESIALARHAAECGADSVVATTPYYFPLSQAEVLSYFEELTLALPLPLYLYNMPGMTKTPIAPDTVARLIHHGGILGIKDSSGDMENLRRLLAMVPERPDWSVYVGPEEFTAEVVKMGGSGGVNGGANLLPALFVENYEAAASGDAARSAQAHAKVKEVLDNLYTVGGSYIRGLKCALSLAGICEDAMTLPFQRFDERERAILRERMVTMGLLPAGE